MSQRKILDVGQCGVDGPWMKKVLTQKLRAVVDKADTGDEAKRKLQAGGYSLVLVNRKLAADNASGIDVIADLRGVDDQTPIMLVSDYEDAQEEAVAKGATRGFGKSVLETDETLELLERTVSGG